MGNTFGVRAIAPEFPHSVRALWNHLVRLLKFACGPHLPLPSERQSSAGDLLRV
jgi:hypothetical protein